MGKNSLLQMLSTQVTGIGPAPHTYWEHDALDHWSDWLENSDAEQDAARGDKNTAHSIATGLDPDGVEGATELSVYQLRHGDSYYTIVSPGGEVENCGPWAYKGKHTLEACRIWYLRSIARTMPAQDVAEMDLAGLQLLLQRVHTTTK